MTPDTTSPQEHTKAALLSLQAAQTALSTNSAAKQLGDRLLKAISFLELLLPELPSGGEPDTDTASDSEILFSALVLPVEEMLQPISTEKPAGVRDMSELRKLQALIIDRSGKPDFIPQYHEAVKLATSLIKNKSKDLAVIMLLIESAFETHGFVALADGLMLVNGILTRYWDDFYPQAPDGDCEKRANELECFDKLVSRFPSKYGDPQNFMPASGSDRTSVQKEKSVFDCIIQQYDVLYKIMYERFQDQSPDLRGLIKAIEPYRAKITQIYNQFTERDQAANAASAELLDRALGTEIDKAKYEEEERQRLQGNEGRNRIHAKNHARSTQHSGCL